jgi:hypothetical protein
MPFYVIIEALSGEILDVVMSLDEQLPSGAIAIELPAPNDDIRRWLKAHKKGAGGGSAGELRLDREDAESAGAGGAPQPRFRDAEQFFARLEQELARAEQGGRHLGVLLFDLAPIDRGQSQEFVVETLRLHGQELLPCDLVARLRDHLTAVLLPDIDARALGIVPERGGVTALTYPLDRLALEALRRRRHPLLRMPRAQAS